MTATMMTTVTIMTVSMITAITTLMTITSTLEEAILTDQRVEEEPMSIIMATVQQIAITEKMGTLIKPLCLMLSSRKLKIIVTSYVALDSSQTNSVKNSISHVMTKTRIGSEVAGEQVSQNTICIDFIL